MKLKHARAGDAHTPLSKLQWVSVDEESWQLDDYSLRPLPSPAHYGMEDVGNQDYSLAVTGDVFRWMINYAPLETLQRVRIIPVWYETPSDSDRFRC